MGGSNSSLSAQQKTIQQLRKQLQQKNKHLNDLKKQNTQLIKQIMPSQRLSKQYNVDTLLHMNYQMFTCLICQNFFDQLIHIPIMACKNQHTICQVCIKNKLALKQKKCFQCDSQLKDHGKNRGVLHLISNKQELLDWVKQRDAGKTSQTNQIKEEVDLEKKTKITLCKFNNFQTMFQINGESILKISPQASWHTIRSVQKLKPLQQSHISFKVIFSIHNSIIIGITSNALQFQKGFIPATSVAFHLNNGHIYDQVSVGQFKWKTGGTPVAKNTNPNMSMVVDNLSNKIKWKVQNKVYAQTKIPQKISLSPMYVFLAIYHKGDIIVFNK